MSIKDSQMFTTETRYKRRYFGQRCSKNRDHRCGKGSRPWLAKAAGKTDVRCSSVCVSDQRSLESGHEGFKGRERLAFILDALGGRWRALNRRVTGRFEFTRLFLESLEVGSETRGFTRGSF